MDLRAPRVERSVDNSRSELMLTAEVSLERTRFLHVNDRTDELPSFGKAGRWATNRRRVRQGKCQVQGDGRRWASLGWARNQLFQLSFAALVPESGMSVECEDERTHRVLQFLPFLRPLVTRKTYPSLRPTEQGLGISRLSVANLKRIARQQPISVSNLPCDLGE